MDNKGNITDAVSIEIADEKRIKSKLVASAKTKHLIVILLRFYGCVFSLQRGRKTFNMTSLRKTVQQ